VEEHHKKIEANEYRPPLVPEMVEKRYDYDIKLKSTWES
jgi:hypothetical protein